MWTAHVAWWNKVVARLDGNLKRRKYRLTSTLYSLDASRSAALLDFGLMLGTYINEQERTSDGSYVDRHCGRLVGPFTSPKAAERFIVATPWFTGRDSTTVT